MMLSTVILFLAYFLVPGLILWLCHRYSFIDKIGAVVIAYVLGAIMGNIGILPEGSKDQLDLIATIAIPIAFPLLLFSLDLRNWYKLAGKTMLSMVLALVSVVSVVIMGYHVFGPGIHSSWKVAGMLIGVYTGGTPNLASIRTALDVDAETYLMIHTYDIALGALFFVFIIAAAQRVLNLVLPPFSKRKSKNIIKVIKDAEGIDNYGGMFSKRYFYPLLMAFALSAAIFAMGGLVSLIVPESIQMAVVILVITTLGILFSLVPRIHNIQKTFQLGMYFIVVFCLAVSSMADLNQLINIENIYIFYYVILAYFGSMLLHVMLSSIFRIDADTVLITMTAFLYSPPFVPVVAGAIKNKEIVLSGVTVGLIGYAVGNYLGVFLAYMLQT